MALKLAKFAVNTTPSEFLTWSKLTEGKVFFFSLLVELHSTYFWIFIVYIDLADYKNVTAFILLSFK